MDSQAWLCERKQQTWTCIPLSELSLSSFSFVSWVLACHQNTDSSGCFDNTVRWNHKRQWHHLHNSRVNTITSEFTFECTSLMTAFLTSTYSGPGNSSCSFSGVSNAIWWSCISSAFACIAMAMLMMNTTEVSYTIMLCVPSLYYERNTSLQAQNCVFYKTQTSLTSSRPP